MAISAVSYLRIVHNTCQVQVAFVFGKAKLTPAHATTINTSLRTLRSRSGVEMTDLVHEELEKKPDSVTYYSDSKDFMFTSATAWRAFVGRQLHTNGSTSLPS